MTEKFDPYAVLGVERDADLKALKAAYKKLAATFHPDKEGGSAEAFAKLKAAYDALADEETRAHFDRTGHLPDAAGDQRVMVIEEIIGAMRETAVALRHAKAKLKHQEFGAMIAGRLAQKLSEIEGMIGSADGMIADFQEAAKRFKRRRGGRNILAEIAIAQITEVERERTNLKRHHKIVYEAIDIVVSHEFERERLLGAYDFTGIA